MRDTELQEVFYRAQKGDKDSIEKILIMFEPLIYKNSFVNGEFNADYFQELNIRLIKCIQSFRFSPDQSIYTYFKQCFN